VGAYGAYRVTRKPRTATQPWTMDLGPPADVRLDAFRYAILAPNPHNRQPWLIQLEGDDTAVITCDPERRLPITDPFDRQITIGFGGFLEIARIAAAERGYKMAIDAFPEGQAVPRLDHRPIARLRFSQDAGVTKDPLFEALLQRRSNKEEYDLTRTATPAELALLMAQASPDVTAASTNNPARVRLIRVLVADAIGAEIDLPRTFQESVNLMRIGHDEIDANPDGVDLGGPLFETLKAIGQLDRTLFADPASSAFRQGRSALVTNYGSATAFIWLSTPGNMRRDQLAAGRDYVRLNLQATAMGLSMHPVSQTLQEYPEMASRFAQVHTLLSGNDGSRVQMLARVGFGPKIEPSPRWPLTKSLVKT
jgi:hypothetical protein